MLRLTTISTDAASPNAPRLALAYHDRVKSRLAALLPDGRAVAITLPRGSVMRGGAVLAGDGGACVVIDAVSEPLARVTAGSPLALLRAVYHLANRHVAAQLAPDAVLIERDPVLERMLAGLGTRVEHIEAPFEPESGAYDAAHSHGHGSTHARDVDEASATIGEQLSIAAHRGSPDR